MRPPFLVNQKGTDFPGDTPLATLRICVIGTSWNISRQEMVLTLGSKNREPLLKYEM